MARVERREADGGVPVFLVETPAPYRVSLTFRVGAADEPVPWRGITHLCEHLSLDAVHGSEHAYNGFTGASLTNFVADGTADDVSAFLAKVTRALAAVPVDRLELERQVLLTEAASRPPSVWAELLFWRCGLSGYGVCGSEEFALHWVDADGVRDWAAQWFTAGNAALWVAGPEPAAVDLELHLPAGERRSPPALGAGYDILPGWTRGPMPGVHVGFIGARESGLTLAGQVLDERLRERLRRSEGLSYAVGGGYEPLTATQAHVLMTADCAPEHAQRTCDAVIEELDRFADEGPTAEELDRCHRVRRAAAQDPLAPIGEAVTEVTNELFGATLGPLDDQTRLLESLTAADVREAAAAARDTAFVMTSGESEVRSGRYTAAPMWSPRTLEGRALRPAPTVAPAAADNRLVVATEGISLVVPGVGSVTVPYEECVVVAAYKGDAMEILGRDGFRIRFHPGDWRDGQIAVGEVRANVPADRIVAMRGEPRVLPHDPEQTRPFREAARRAERRRMLGRVSVIAAIVAMVAVAVVAAVAGHPTAVVAGVVGAVFGIRSERDRR